MVSVDLTANTDVHSLDEFRHLVVKRQNGALVRLEDVANVVLGAENYDFNVAFSGQHSVFIGIKVAPRANILDVVARVRAALPDIAAQLPTGVTQKIAYDSTMFITSSINEVIKTLVEALIIVTVVIFLFLGSPRAVIVPVVAMPLSLVGAFFIMLAFGYSINLLTLLALVLAIGLVVDDAIIVVENVDRHLKEGASPLEAALQAARELGGPIIAMTIVLVAAYVPIGFQGGLTGALFTQFAFTLAGAVTISGVIALTLSPMMCSKVLQRRAGGRALHSFPRPHLQPGAHCLLAAPVQLAHDLAGAGAVRGAAAALRRAPGHDLEIRARTGRGSGRGARADDRPAQCDARADADLFRRRFCHREEVARVPAMFQLTGAPSVNQGFGGVLFKPWDQRKRNANQIQQLLQSEWSKIPGARVAAFQFPALPGSQGLPMQFVITTTEPIQNLNEVATQVLDKARASGMFCFIDSDLKLDKPQADPGRRPRHGGGPRAHAAERGRRARRRARRRLRQLLLDRRPLLQGDPAGAADRPPESQPGARLLRALGRWLADPGTHRGEPHDLASCPRPSATSSSSTPPPSLEFPAPARPTP